MFCFYSLRKLWSLAGELILGHVARTLMLLLDLQVCKYYSHCILCDLVMTGLENLEKSCNQRWIRKGIYEKIGKVTKTYGSWKIALVDQLYLEQSGVELLS